MDNSNVIHFYMHAQHFFRLLDFSCWRQVFSFSLGGKTSPTLVKFLFILFQRNVGSLSLTIKNQDVLSDFISSRSCIYIFILVHKCIYTHTLDHLFYVNLH